MSVPTDEQLDAIETKALERAASGVASSEMDGRKVVATNVLDGIAAARQSRPVGNGWNRVGKSVAVFTGRMGNGGDEA